jgi:phage tail-like protein
MPAGVRSKDPLLQFQFAVEFNFDPFGLLPPIIPITGYFTEISGLNVEWEVTEYKTTNFLALPHSNHVIGRPVYQPVTLRRGVTGSESFWLWHQLLALGTKPIMKNYVTISMYDRNYKLKAQWSLERAWPTKVSGPEIRADGNDFAIEELTLTHGGIMRMYLEPGMELMNILMQQMLP